MLQTEIGQFGLNFIILCLLCSTGISNLFCDYVHQQQQWRTVEMIELSNNRIVNGLFSETLTLTSRTVDMEVGILIRRGISPFNSHICDYLEIFQIFIVK